MKQILWIYGRKGSGKHQFCQEISNKLRWDMRIIDNICKYSDLEKYTGQPIINFKTFSPEHCTPDLCAKIIKDFKTHGGYFSGSDCQLLIITAWYPPDIFYDNAYFAFNQKFQIKQNEFQSLFKTVYDFNQAKDKEIIMEKTISLLYK